MREALFGWYAVGGEAVLCKIFAQREDIHGAHILLRLSCSLLSNSDVPRSIDPLTLQVYRLPVWRAFQPHIFPKVVWMVTNNYMPCPTDCESVAQNVHNFKKIFF